MALIICKECGNKISDKAATCPHCGCPNSVVTDANMTEYKKLVEYLKQVYDVEKNKYVLEAMINKLRFNKKVFYEAVISKPVIPPEPTYTAPKYVERGGGLGYVCLAVGGFFTFVFLIVVANWMKSDSYVDGDGPLLLYFLLGPVVVLLGKLMMSYNKKKNETARNQFMANAEREFNEKKKEYTSAVAKLKSNYNIACNSERNKVDVHNQCIDAEISRLTNMLNGTKEILEQYYAMNILHTSYRGLVEVSQIYDYLDSRKCYTLDGPGGAYAVFDVEKRLDKIVTKLDIVIERLDSISANQKMLANVINQSTRAIVNGVGSFVSQLSGEMSSISSRLNNIQIGQQEMNDMQNRLLNNAEMRRIETEIIRENTDRMRQLQQWEADREWYGRDAVRPPV